MRLITILGAVSASIAVFASPAASVEDRDVTSVISSITDIFGLGGSSDSSSSSTNTLTKGNKDPKTCSNYDSCSSRGSGWSCDSDCKCNSPPDWDGCKDDNAWNTCLSREGDWGCNKDCSCKPPANTCQSTSVWEVCLKQGYSCDQKCQCICTLWSYKYCYINHLGAPDIKKGCACSGQSPTYPWGWPNWKRSDVESVTAAEKREVQKQKAVEKRMASKRNTMCPRGKEACLTGSSAKDHFVECIDTQSTLDSCGGCTMEGMGKDCTAIEGVDVVSCVKGQCRVNACESGYTVGGNGTTCVLEEVMKSEQKILLGSVIGTAEKVLGW